MFSSWKKPTPVLAEKPSSNMMKRNALRWIINEAKPFKVGYRLSENHLGAMYIFSTAYPQKHCFLSFSPFHDYVEVADLESPTNVDIILDENNTQIILTPNTEDISMFLLMLHQSQKNLTDYLTKVAIGEIEI